MTYKEYESSSVTPALITGDTMSIGITHPFNDKGAIKYPVMTVDVGDGLAFAFDRTAADALFRFIYNERDILFPNGQIVGDES